MSACVSLWISCTTTKKRPNLFFFPLLGDDVDVRCTAFGYSQCHPSCLTFDESHSPLRLIHWQILSVPHRLPGDQHGLQEHERVDADDEAHGRCEGPDEAGAVVEPEVIASLSVYQIVMIWNRTFSCSLWGQIRCVSNRVCNGYGPERSQGSKIITGQLWA